MKKILTFFILLFSFTELLAQGPGGLPPVPSVPVGDGIAAFLFLGGIAGTIVLKRKRNKKNK